MFDIKVIPVIKLYIDVGYLQNKIHAFFFYIIESTL